AHEPRRRAAVAEVREGLDGRHSGFDGCIALGERQHLVAKRDARVVVGLQEAARFESGATALGARGGDATADGDRRIDGGDLAEQERRPRADGGVAIVAAYGEKGRRGLSDAHERAQDRASLGRALTRRESVRFADWSRKARDEERRRGGPERGEAIESLV